MERTGTASPELDAQVLICHATKKDKTFLLSHPEYRPSLVEKTKINLYLNRRKKNEPIAYITGHKEFYNSDFLVNKDVLIPRPESEWLVEQGSKIIEYRLLNIEKSNNQNPSINILDIGTGSGCIIVSLVKELTRLDAYKPISLSASEISSQSLRVARKNAKRHKVDQKINFILSDLFSNPKLHKKFDLIIANLPYVPKQVKSQKLSVSAGSSPDGKVKSDGIDFEPQNAIFADDNGSAVIKKFLEQSRNHLADDGIILIELDPRNALELKKYAKTIYPQAKIELSNDLAGLARYLKIRL